MEQKISQATGSNSQSVVLPAKGNPLAGGLAPQEAAQ